MSKFYYFWQHWEDAGIDELEANSWEEVPAAWMKKYEKSEFKPDSIEVFEVVERRNVSLKEVIQKFKNKKAKEAKELELKNKLEQFEKLKKELGM